MTEGFIELGVLIIVTLISLGVVIRLLRNAKKHELAVRSLDKEIERKTGIRMMAVNIR